LGLGIVYAERTIPTVLNGRPDRGALLDLDRVSGHCQAIALMLLAEVDGKHWERCPAPRATAWEARLWPSQAQSLAPDRVVPGSRRIPPTARS
jgi:hypothetical protein